MIFKALTPIVLHDTDGTITIQAGDFFRSASYDPVTQGYARELTAGEQREVLGGYVAEAREVFKAEEPGVCHACKGTGFRTSVKGVVVCRTCHPPASPELERREVEVRNTWKISTQGRPSET